MSSGWCWYYKNGVTQNEQRNEHAKLWVFREMETVATDVQRLTATAVARGLAPSSSEEIAKMARCRRQKHHSRWPGNPNGQSKFQKYRAPIRNWHLRDRDWCSAVDRSFQRSLKRHVAKVKNITSDEQVILRIDWNYEVIEMYTYKIAQSLPKDIFLLLWHRWYCAIFFLLSLAMAFVLTY